MIFRGIPVALLATAIAMGAEPASSLDSAYVPSEPPPAGFSGAQYVDSLGCAFVRAGIGGEVVWIPRMTRDHAPICGLEPSVSTEATAPVAAPRATAQTTKTAKAPAAPARARPVPVATAPRAATVPAALSALPPDRWVRVICPPVEGVNYSYRARAGDPLRCGERTASKPLYRLPDPPKGYRYAFGAGRHNPNRGERSAAGTATMNQIWTDDLPRQLAGPDALTAGLRTSP